jgi:hypothetical protein
MKHTLAYFALVLLLSCAPTTQNPTNPEADSPLELGGEVSPPYGCLLWRAMEGEDADC